MSNYNFEIDASVVIDIDDTDVVSDGLYQDIVDAFLYKIERDMGVELASSKYVIGAVKIIADIKNEEDL